MALWRRQGQEKLGQLRVKARDVMDALHVAIDSHARAAKGVRSIEKQIQVIMFHTVTSSLAVAVIFSVYTCLDCNW